jgi:membrane fusion protein, heavy metal efflux system
VTRRHWPGSGAIFFCAFALALAALPPVARSDDDDHAATGKLPNQVTLTSQQATARDIAVAPAAAGTADATVHAPATVRFDRDLVTMVGPMLPAKVVKVTKDLGDTVKPGDAVAILDSVELGKVKAHYLVVQSRLALARDRYEREKRLVAQKISSRAELQQAEAEYQQAQADLDSTEEELRLYGLSHPAIRAIRPGTTEPFSRYVLTSPQGGIVEKRAVTPGQALTAESTPIEIVDPSRMWIMIDANEQDASRLRPGERVAFTARAMPGRTVTGTIDWVGRALSPTTRTLPARATVENPDGVLRSGMFGTAEIAVGSAVKLALVPVAAVQTVDGRQIVFAPVAGKAGSYQVVPVVTGAESDGRVEIRSGVAPGEKIVVRGAFALMSILTAATRQDSD